MIWRLVKVVYMDLMMLLMFSPLLGLAMFLILPSGPALQLYIPVLALGIFFNFKMMRSMHLPKKNGPDEMIGEESEALEAIDPEGKASIHGEIWNARAISPGYRKGQKAKVCGVQGLVLLLADPVK